MIKKVQVSIIIPNYNHSLYLQKRIDSVLNQTYQDFELILLDDASTDDSLAIMAKYKDHGKVSHINVNKKNSGSPFKQWIKGIKLAKGDFIWIAESDDYAEDSFLEETVQILQNNKKSNLVYVDSKIVDDNNTKIDLWSIRKNKRYKTQKWSNDYDESGKREVIDYLLYSTTINNASAVLFRKQSLDKPGFLNELSGLKTAGDLFTYINVALQGEISYIAKPLNNYRTHLLNVTKKNTKSGLLYIERLKCFKISLYLFEELDLIIDEVDALKKGYMHILRKNGFSLVDFGFGKELDHFIMRLKQLKILNRKESDLYRFLFKTYSLKLKLLKKMTKKLIKRVL